MLNRISNFKCVIDVKVVYGMNTSQICVKRTLDLKQSLRIKMIILLN